MTYQNTDGQLVNPTRRKEQKICDLLNITKKQYRKQLKDPLFRKMIAAIWPKLEAL